MSAKKKQNGSDLTKQIEWGIQRATYIPLYHQVKEAIYNKILEGYWARGEPIPSERNLSEMMGVSRITVIRALKELTAAGILRREKGRGTFVAEQKNNETNSNRIGVVIHRAEFFIDSFFSDIFLGIQETAAQLGFEPILIPYSDNSEWVKEGLFCINNIWKKKLGSIIIAVEEIDEVELEHLKEQDIPFVMLNKQLTKVEGDWLAIDWELGMYKLIKKLLERGYREFGYLGGLLGKFPSDREKYLGVQRALAEAGIKLNLNLFVEWAYERRNEVSEVARKLIESMPPSGVIICSDDHFGAHVIKNCYELGLKIPEDIAVTGTGDFNIASNIHPGLTTIRADRYKLGQQAVLIIQNRLSGKSTGEGYLQLKFEPQVIVRDSIANSVCSSLSKTS